MRDITPDVVADWAHRARTALRRHRREIDALNVFPIPDGDTGTNVLLTVESGVAEVDLSLSTAQVPGSALAAFAHGALMGARGNSGVILSQVLRGVSEAISEAPQTAAIGGAALAAALQRASAAAYRAVSRPVEGTILTVVRAASEAAAEVLRTQPTASASAVLDAAYRGAEAALAQTTQMLDALRRAGVVDAGGKAFLVVLGALRDAVDGRDPDDDADLDADVPVLAGAGGSTVAQPPGSASAAPGCAPAGQLADRPVEVMFLLDASEGDVDLLRERLDELGDSVVVVGGAGLWNVHVHVPDVSAAGRVLESALSVGRPHRLELVELPATWSDAGGDGLGHPGRVLVAVTHGAGMRDVLTAAGVECVLVPPGIRAATREILQALADSDARSAGAAREVVILPGDADTQGVAQSAASEIRQHGRRVAVIPTRSIVQTLAAVAVHSTGADFDTDVIAMTRAAGATRYGAVTIAHRDALTTAGPCRVGDVLGLVDGDIADVGVSVVEVARDLVTGLLAIGGELVTCVFGVDADDDIRGLPAWIRSRFPLAEVVVHEGGQSLWPVIIGVE